MWFGRRWQVETAAKLVSEIIDKGPPVAVTLGDNTPEGEFKRTVGCDKKTLGRLIGRQGSTIGYLQTHSKCRIQIDRDALPEPIVTVSADDEKTVPTTACPMLCKRCRSRTHGRNSFTWPVGNEVNHTSGHRISKAAVIRGI